MHADNLKTIQKQWHGTLKAYLIGLTASLVLTGTSFLLVHYDVLAKPHLISVIVVLALVQAAFQLRYFLHLGQEDHPRWESWVFYFMLLLLLIVVLGSLWIMYDLDQRVMAGMMFHD